MSLVLQDELLISPKVKEQVIQNTADIKTIEEKIKNGVYKFKGAVEKYSDLPIEGNDVGDVYNVRTADKSHGILAGDNVAWDGEEWDNLGSYIDLSPYALQADLELEKNTRIVADTTLTNDLNKEIQDRANADTNILDTVDTINTNLTTNITTVSNNLINESTNRQTIDTKIINNIWSNSTMSDGYFKTKNTQSDTSYGQLWNENSGGGILYYNQPLNISSFVGVNKSSASDKVDVQIYAKDKTSNIGTRVNVSSTEGMYYLKNCKNLGFPAEREVAVIENIPTKTSDLNNDSDYTTNTLLNTGLASKIDKYNILPEASKEYIGKIVQYTGETSENYINAYFYKCIENGDLPDSIEFTSKPGVSTVVSITPEDFIAFVTPWCEGRSFEPSDVTHGDIGIYSSTQYAMTIMTDDGDFAHGVFTITELEAAGFSFVPKFSSQQGATFVCSIGQKAYIWEQINVQPETDISALQTQIQTLAQQINDLKLTIPKEAFTADEVRTMTKQSGKVTLCEDVDLGTVSLVDGTFANNKTSINLNEHTLSASPTGGRALLQLRGSSQYTFNGNGTVEDFADDSSCVWSRTKDNVLTINGGTWIAHGHTETIYCQLGTININGGVFKTDAEDKRYLLNCLDTNFKAGTAKIIVKGGEFWDFDPSANPEGPDTSYVAEGYTVESREEDEHIVYTVRKI